MPSSVLERPEWSLDVHGKERPAGRHEAFTPWPGAGRGSGTIRHGGLGHSPLGPAGLAVLGHRPRLRAAARAHGPLGADQHASGRAAGLGGKDLATLYDVGILTYVGCPVYGNEAALLFGDDIDFRAHAIEVDLAGFPAMVFMLRRAGHGTSAFNRARQTASLMASGGRQVVQQMADHCSAAGALATRLGLSEDVQAGIEQAYARWDGRGVPDDLSGTGLSLAARVSHVAEACEVFERTAGIEAALDVVRSRSGTHFDPEIAKLVATDPESLFDDLDRDTVDELLAAEPTGRAR